MANWMILPDICSQIPPIDIDHTRYHLSRSIRVWTRALLTIIRGLISNYVHGLCPRNVRATIEKGNSFAHDGKFIFIISRYIAGELIVERGGRKLGRLEINKPEIRNQWIAKIVANLLLKSIKMPRIIFSVVLRVSDNFRISIPSVYLRVTR